MRPLEFIRYRVKAYARTPDGELAYGDAQGLYEWRGGTLIFYSGGDRQASDPSGFWTTSSSGVHQQAYQLGRAAAMSRVRLN